jgi:hypothetical protein
LDKNGSLIVDFLGEDFERDPVAEKSFAEAARGFELIRKPN